MKLLQKINQNDFEPQGYTVRKVVKTVILDKDGTRCLFFGNHLVGGGVELGETDEEALAREAMEEVGAKIEIVKPLGEVIAYRDPKKTKYIVHGYLSKHNGNFESPTTLDPEEQQAKIEWVEVKAAIKRLNEEIHSITQRHLPNNDIFQAQVHNRMTSLAFLQEI